MSQGQVRVSTEAGLARVTLDRPPLNVLTIAMMRELAAALGTAATDSAVRVIRIDGEGRAFSAGVDVGEHLDEHLVPMMDALDALFRAFETVPQPVVAVVHGACLGGGLEVASGCDLCVASETATFGQPEIKLGVFAPPATVLLPRLIGERAAAGLLLTGEPVDAQEAKRLGIVTALLPAEGFAQAAEAWVARLTAMSGPGLRAAKRALVEQRDRPARAAHERLHRIYLDELMTTEDAHEGLRAFLDKRPPVWRHR